MRAKQTRERSSASQFAPFLQNATSMTKVSIALATYNGAQFVQEQLRSLSEQTRLPDELVVADDGSTDGTIEMIQAFASRSSFRVRLLPQTSRLGYKANFLRCAEHCKGDLIAFCDQDDIWFPDKLARQCEVLRSTQVMMSTHRVDLCDGRGEKLSRRYDFFDDAMTASFDDLKPFPFALGMTICVKRQCLAWDGLWRASLDWHNNTERMAHDQWYPFIASLMGFTHFESEPLAFYRQHSSNVSGPRLHRFSPSRIRAKLASHSDEYDRLSRSASNCSSIIRMIAKRPIRTSTPPPVVLERAARLYDRYSDAFVRRKLTTETRSPCKKAHALTSALRSGDYRFGSQWHFRPHSILRDILDFGLV